MNDVARRYRGFISYSKKDKTPTRRLHRALESFRMPRGAVGHAVDARTRRLGRFFRDDDEMGASSNLDDALRAAIEDSESLIVVCSPNAAASVWVNQEIIHFKLSGRASRIFAVIVDGVANASASVNAAERAKECFPPALRFEVEPDGAVSDRPEEPLAIDLRKEPFARVRARLAAGLAGVSFDDLWQRDRRRARGRAAAWASGFAALAAVAGASTWLALSQMTLLQRNVSEAKATTEVERAARTQTEAKNVALDAEAQRRRDETLNQRADRATILAESYFAKDSTSFDPKTDKAVAAEEAARWNAAALVYGIALLKGDDVARSMLDRLGYVRVPINATANEAHLAPDGSTVVTHEQNDVRVTWLATAKSKLVKGAGSIPAAIQPGRYVAARAPSVAGSPRHITIVDVRTGASRAVDLPALGKRDPVVVFANAADLVAAALEGQLVVWRARDGTELAHTFYSGRTSADQKQAQETYPERIFFTPDDRRIVIIESTKDMQTYDLQAKTWTAPQKVGFSDAASLWMVHGPRVFSPYSGDSSQGAMVYDITSGKAEKAFKAPSSDIELDDPAVSPDGRYILTNTKDGLRMRIHDLQTGAARDNAHAACAPVTNADSDNDNECDSANAFLFRSQPFAVIDNGYDNVRVVDLATGQTTRVLDKGDKRMAGIATTGDGKRIVGIGAEENADTPHMRVALWDAATGKLLSRSGRIDPEKFTGIEADTYGRTLAGGGMVWRSLAPAGETTGEALDRLCAVRGPAGMPISPEDLKFMPPGTPDNVCAWPRAKPAASLSAEPLPTVPR